LKNAVEPEMRQMTIKHGACAGMLDNWDYKHTLRICNTYCFSMASLVAWMCLNVMCTLPVLCWFTNYSSLT